MRDPSSQGHTKPSDIPSLTSTEIAELWAQAENSRASAMYRLARVNSRRSFRLLNALAQIARGRLGPRRAVQTLRSALERQPAPEKPSAVYASDMASHLEPIGAKPGLNGEWKPYDHLRIGWIGPTPRFTNECHVVPLDSNLEWADLGREGIDLVVATDESIPDIIAAGDRAGIPVVFLADSARPLDLDGLAAYTAVFTESEPQADLLNESSANPNVHLLNPAVDTTSFNPMGWQRESATTAAVWTTRRDRTADAVLLNPIRDRVSSTTGSRVERVLAAREHLAVLDAPGWHESEESFLQSILELAASGVPVITIPTERLQSMIPSDLLNLSGQPEETAPLLDALLDSEYRERQSVRVRNHVVEKHSMRRQLEDILVAVGLPVRPLEKISVLLATRRPDAIAQACRQVAAQTYSNKELVVVLHGLEDEAEAQVPDNMEIDTVVLHAPGEWTLGDCLNLATWHSSGDLLTKMDDDDFYGPNHLRDLVLAREYSHADIVGKRGNWVYLAERDLTISWGASYQESSPVHIPGATMLYDRELARRYPFRRLSQGEDSDFFTRVRLDGGSLYSTHRYNFVRHRHGQHAFAKADDEFIDEADGPPMTGLPARNLMLDY